MINDPYLAYRIGRASTLEPCGETITLESRGMRDEDGHPIAMFHSDVIAKLVRIVAAVTAVHRREPEGIVPFCAHCRTAWPCPTAGALEQP